MIRFGIIGMGKMGRIRAREIAARSDAEVVAISDVNPTALKGYTGVRAYSDPQCMLAEDLDAVVISAYNNVAAEFTLAALASGKHVLCEKPPARRVAELEGVGEAAREHNLVLKYGFNHRYHYSVMEAKRIVDAQAFGELLWMKGTYGKAGGSDYERQWRSNPNLSGGGILIDQGIHMLDLMLLFCGEIRDVSSILQSSYLGGSVEDNVFAIMRSNNGVSMMLHSSAVLWRHRFLLEMCFEDGMIVLDGILSSTRSYADETLVLIRRQFEDSFAMGKPREERTYFDQDNSWKLELEEFVQAIRGNGPVRNGTIQDALMLMRTVERIYSSSGFYEEHNVERGEVAPIRRRAARRSVVAGGFPARSAAMG